MSYPKHITTLLKQFSQYLIARKSKAKSTETAYLYSIKLFLNFYQGNIDNSLSTVTIDEDIFVEFLYFLKEKRNKYKPDKLLSPTTISRHLSALRTFWSFLYHQDMASGPLTLDEMDIELVEQSNKTKPLREDNFIKFTKELAHVLSKIY